MEYLGFGQRGVERRLRVVDGRGRLLGLVNPVDLAIVLVAAALVFGAGYKLLSPRASAPVRTVRFEFVAQAVEPQVAALVHPGDYVTSSRGPAAVATEGPFAQPAKVVRVEVGPFMARVTTATGRARNPDPYLKDVHLWVEGTVPVTGGSIDLVGEQIRAGTDFTLDSRLWELDGTVERVEVK
jgi:hypothetical protein